MKNICPLCKSNSLVIKNTITLDESASHFVNKDFEKKKFDQLLNHISQLIKKNFFTIYKCKNCYFVFSYPYIAGDKSFYNLAYSKSYYHPKNKWEFETSINIIKKSKKKNLKILEIGSGYGQFLKQLINKKIAKPAHITSIEYSDFGKKEINALGIECHQLDIRNKDLKTKYLKYDFICLFQVLEHMDDINYLLKKIRSYLSKNGQILISVPHDKNIEFNESNGALLDMPPNHIGRWCKKSFSFLAKKNRLKIENYKIENTNYFRFVGTFYYYRFLKKSQKSQNYQSHIKFNSYLKKYKKVLIILSIICDVICNFNYLLKIYKHKKKFFGSSVFIALSKSSIK